MSIYETKLQVSRNFKVLLIRLSQRLSIRTKLSITTNLMHLSIVGHDDGGYQKQQKPDVFYGDFANAFDYLWNLVLV